MRSMFRLAVILALAVTMIMVPATQPLPVQTTVDAQSDAGFLDSPDPIINLAEWHGSGWYCIDGVWPNRYIVAGPWQSYPDCSIY